MATVNEQVSSQQRQQDELIRNVQHVIERVDDEATKVEAIPPPAQRASISAARPTDETYINALVNQVGITAAMISCFRCPGYFEAVGAFIDQ